MTLHTSRYHALVFAALVFFFCSCGRSEIDYVTSPDKGLVMASLYSDIVVKSTDAATTDDFDDYNFNTSMLKKHKFCNKDTNGNYIETHFLDYVVNACKIKLDNKPHDNK